MFTLSELSEKPEEHSRLLWDIEQKMEHEDYRRKVEELLASGEVSNELANDFAQRHGKEGERGKYQNDLKKKKRTLNDKAMDVYKLLADSVFRVSNDPDDQSALQWEIERRLTGTSQIDRLYQRKVAELLAAGKVNEQDKRYLAETEQTDAPPSNNEGGIALQVFASSSSPEASSPSESGSTEHPGKMSQDLKWYFTNTHSKYTERYHFMMMEEDERRKSFLKRFFHKVYKQHKREELKEKIHHGQSYEQVIDNLMRDLRGQMRYLQGQFTPKNKEQRMMICENMLQSMVDLEVKYLGSMIRDRASTRVKQLESKRIDQLSGLMRSVPLSMWATAGATVAGIVHPQKVEVVNFPHN